MSTTSPAVTAEDGCGFRIRPATADDLADVIALDSETTGLPKPRYWRDMVARLGAAGDGPTMLIAEKNDAFAGFIIGEIRAWEFGSQPCGWIFALSVKPEHRGSGIATMMFEAICDIFRAGGVEHVRTMIRRDHHLLMAFFRSQGMMAGPFVQLERDLFE